MGFTRIFWAALCLSFIPLAQYAAVAHGIQGHDVVASDHFLDQLPLCAVSCYTAAKANSSCQSGWEGCICPDANLKASMLSCAATACPVVSQLEARNVLDTLCGISARNLDTLTRLICWAGMLVSGAFVLLRLLSKIFLAEQHSPPLACLTPDDGLTIMAYLLSLPCYYIAAFKLLDAGLGRDQWTLTPQQVTDFSYWLYIMEPIYLATLWFIKTSFLVLFIRLFATGQTERFCVRGYLKLRHALWGTAIANTLCLSSFILTFIFQCTPVSYTWTKWQGEDHGTCVNVNAVICAHGALGIAFDLWILYLPMSQLSSMHLPGRKKVQVGFMLGIGAIATLVSFLRLQGLVAYATSPNATRENYGGTAWSMVEVAIGIICTSLPAARLLLIRITPEAWRRVKGRPPQPTSTEATSRPPSAQPRHSYLLDLRAKVPRPMSTFTKHSNSTKASFFKTDSFSSARQPSIADCLVEKLAASSKGGPSFTEAIAALSVALGKVPDDRSPNASQGSEEKETKPALNNEDGHADASAATLPKPYLASERRPTPDYFSVPAHRRRAVGPATMAATKWLQQHDALDTPSEAPEGPQQGEEQKQKQDREQKVDATAPIPLVPAEKQQQQQQQQQQEGLGPARPLASGAVSDSTTSDIDEPEWTVVAPRKMMSSAAHLRLSPVPPSSGWSTFGVSGPSSPSTPREQGELGD